MGKTISLAVIYYTYTDNFRSTGKQKLQGLRQSDPLTMGSDPEPCVWTPLWEQPPPVVVSRSRACYVVPLAEARGVYSTEAWKQSASWQKRGGILREKRKIKLSTHLHYIVLLSLSQKFCRSLRSLDYIL